MVNASTKATIQTADNTPYVSEERFFFEKKEFMFLLGFFFAGKLRFRNNMIVFC